MHLKLRPFQKQALDLLKRRSNAHLICIAPTGSGKSLIFERTAAQYGRRLVLVSPLVALARQQYHRFKSLGIGVILSAGDSRPGRPPQSGVWIMSPEKIPSLMGNTLLSNWAPNVLAVDECHCLWEWGQEFRPAFMQLPSLVTNYHIAQSLWLTATLCKDARKLLTTLLPKPQYEIGSFALAPQLTLQLTQVPWRSRPQALLLWLESKSYGVLIFVSTRAMALRLFRFITSIGRKVIVYHGGMSQEERKNVEQMAEKGQTEIIVATSAFGMGMNYSHLQFVLVWQSPASVLSLVQAIGRVGRASSKDAHASVFWDNADFELLEWTLSIATCTSSIERARRQKNLTDLGNFYRSSECRSKWLSEYFNESNEHPAKCNQCDICRLSC